MKKTKFEIEQAFILNKIKQIVSGETNNGRKN